MRRSSKWSILPSFGLAFYYYFKNAKQELRIRWRSPSVRTALALSVRGDNPSLRRELCFTAVLTEGGGGSSPSREGGLDKYASSKAIILEVVLLLGEKQ